MNAETAGHAGTPQLKQFLMVSIKEFRGNELAQASAVKEDLTCSSSSPLNKSDQVISLRAHDGERERAPGPGLKLQAPSNKLQAPSFKLQASQATSYKLQAPLLKLQASSRKLQAPRSLTLEKVSRHPNRGALPR